MAVFSIWNTMVRETPAAPVVDPANPPMFIPEGSTWNSPATGTGPANPTPSNPSPNITPGPEPTKDQTANPITTQPESIASRLFGVNPTLPIVQKSEGANIQQAGFGSGWVVIIIILVLILSPIKMKAL